MTLLRGCLSRRVRFGINQALQKPCTAKTPTSTTASQSLAPLATGKAAPAVGGSVGSLAGLVSRRHLRVTRTPPQTPPMPPMDLRYNYAAGVFIVVLFTWAALTPEDDGFNTLLGGGGMDDDDDDDDDDVRYDGTGYEGRDKALVGGSSGAGRGSSSSSSSSSSSGVAASSNRAAERD